jgi:hypothetical protein
MNTKIVKSSENRRPPRAGMGRPAGVPNKATSAFRETVNRVLEDNAENVSKWLREVGLQDPARALDLLVKMAEYAVPKLSRQEVTAVVTGDSPPRPTMIEIVAVQREEVLAALHRKHST